MRHACQITLPIMLWLLHAGLCLPHPGGHRSHSPAAPSGDATAPVMLAQAGRRPPGPGTARPAADSPAAAIAEACAAFVARGQIQTRSDDRYFSIESNGIPQHPLMIGITAWQQQVPLPQPYTGANAWQIPIHPVPAREPRTTKGAFLRGAIAVAVNGIPIFNPLNNRGEDAFLIGELDTFGGHCGRADDYHYHIAPVHLQETVGKTLPIAYALDGYPIYGYEEPDGSPVRKLDTCNGHTGPDGRYHYHATKQYPYLNGGFHGEVVERDGQVDPQPRARPIRPALPPLRGATITDYTSDGQNQAELTYEIAGRAGTVACRQGADGSITFNFNDPDGTHRTETHRPPPAARNGSPPDRGPPEGRPRKLPPQKQKRAGKRPTAEKRLGTPATRTQAGSRASPATGAGALTVTSQSVTASGQLATACTCDGDGVSPAIAWSKVPSGTRSLALSLWHVAPDQEKSYWVVTNIPPTATSLPQAVRLPTATSDGPRLGRNDRGQRAYDPPCSQGPGLKTYHVTVFALSDVPAFPTAGPTRTELLNTIGPITLATGTLDLTVERKTQR